MIFYNSIKKASSAYLMFLIIVSCVSPDNKTTGNIENKGTEASPIISEQKSAFIDTTYADSGYKVTFIEFGSEVCYACQQMQVVMKSIEEKYRKQVKVVFHDVRTPEGRSYAEWYDIDIIPTQVFLDEGGMEYYRHQDYFPEEDLVKVLNLKGVE